MRRPVGLVLLLCCCGPTSGASQSPEREASPANGPHIAEFDITPANPEPGGDATATVVIRDERGVRGFRLSVGNKLEDFSCGGQKVCSRMLTRVVPERLSGRVTVRLVAENTLGQRTSSERSVSLRGGPQKAGSPTPKDAPPSSSSGQTARGREAAPAQHQRLQRFGVDGASPGVAEAIAELGDGWSGVNGVSWGDIEPRLSPGGAASYNWQRLDDLARRFQPTQRRLQVNLRVFHEAALEHGAGRPRRNPLSGNRMSAISRIRPDSLGHWSAMVQALVERYDADGNADMPGLDYPVITHIQIESEPENVWLDASGYLGALCAAHAASRRASPEARVLAAGFNVGGFFARSEAEQERLAGQAPEILRRKRAFFDAFFAQGAGCFDILTLHLTDLQGIAGTAAWFSKGMRERAYQKPIWADDVMSLPNLGAPDASPAERAELARLESGSPDAVRRLEREQASLVVKKAVAAFAAGLEKVFISTDVDWPKYHLAIWRHMGLLDARGRRKPAYGAFKTMVEQLDGFLACTRLDWGDRLVAHEFKASDRTTVVLWSADEGAVDLSRWLGSRIVELVDLESRRASARSERVVVGGSPVFLVLGKP